MPDRDGKELVSGVRFEVDVNLLLSNHSPVDTSIKDIYININYGKNKKVRLRADPYVQRTVIGPRRIWRPYWITFFGSVWGIDEPPSDMKAELIAELLAQRPLRKAIKVHFLS